MKRKVQIKKKGVKTTWKKKKKEKETKDKEKKGK